MSKAAEGLNTATEHVKPSRRHALSVLAVAPVIAAVPVVRARAKAPESSAKIAAAFAEWRSAEAAMEAAFEAEDPGLARYHAILPEQPKWKRPLNAEQQAACDAAKEMSGLTALEAASSAALDKAHNLFLGFLAVRPETMADVILQAKHLKEWLHACHVELPAEVWLESVTGQAWPDDGTV